MKYIFWAVWAVCFIVMLRHYRQQNHPLLSATISMLCGVGALIVFHYFGQNFGFTPPINLFNTMLSLILGLPSLLLIYIANLL
jgi:hypothetical protein